MGRVSITSCIPDRVSMVETADQADRYDNRPKALLRIVDAIIVPTFFVVSEIIIAESVAHHVKPRAKISVTVSRYNRPLVIV